MAPILFVQPVLCICVVQRGDELSSVQGENRLHSGQAVGRLEGSLLISLRSFKMLYMFKVMFLARLYVVVFF